MKFPDNAHNSMNWKIVSSDNSQLLCHLSLRFRGCHTFKCKMEEAQEKLANLMKNVQDKKINLKKIKSFKKYEKHFELNFKWKVLMVTAVLSMIYSKFGHLLNSKNVSKKFRFHLKPYKYFK